METAKGTNVFSFEHYKVLITVFNEKKLEITVIDPIEKFEFHEGLLTLQNIGTTTLMKALEKSALEVKMSMQINKAGENTILQIDVLVASQFLKPVEETIYIKKCRDISESEILKNAIENISTKIKMIKENGKVGPNVVKCGNIKGEKLFNSANYETIASLTLPKGKHILTLSFLAKITSAWMYLYFQQGQVVIQNNGFYVQNTSNYMPFVMKKEYTVTQNEENVQFTTYCANSYPFSLKNIVISAQEVK